MNHLRPDAALDAAAAAAAVGAVADAAAAPQPLLELQGGGKRYGTVIALEDVSLQVHAGSVVCVLGDNGAGKSTLIKILSGLHRHDSGSLRVLGEEVRFASPRDARDLGIATVYQDLAVAPLMPVWRNFFLGSELVRGRGPFARLQRDEMREVTRRELAEMGIDLRDVDQPSGTLSGGERQCLAIARALYFGAKVLILDEPTAALGVKQSAIVLRYVQRARARGLGVVFITHNPSHAYAVGDQFLVLKRGRTAAYRHHDELCLEELSSLMMGGGELEEVLRELQ